MATFLDVTALENFSVIFVFLLVAVGGYAILLSTKVFGDKQFVIVLVSILTALFVIMSPLATLVVKSIAPVMAVVLILVTLISLSSSMFGSGQMEALNSLKWVVFVVLVIAIIVGSLSIVRENIKVPERGEDFSKVSTVIFHPNFLGMILILSIAIFTVALLASKQG
ncbi:hypothetical protein HYX01_03600 [Candidatus Woesearchaeota archaeon]|nr:hypothetical protein [Candidatus Woesearchaeota archaeon]